MQLHQQALAAQFSALESRPGDRQGWQTLLQYCDLADGCIPYRQLAERQLQSLKRWTDH